MSLVIIFDSASESTTIMAVAAEKPPRNTRIDIAWLPTRSGSSSMKLVGLRARREHQQPGDGDGQDEHVDEEEVEREHPRHRTHVALVLVLHDQDVELPRAGT